MSVMQKFRNGQKWKTRAGRIVTIVDVGPRRHIYPVYVYDPQGESYTCDYTGRRWLTLERSEYDLIELITTAHSFSLGPISIAWGRETTLTSSTLVVRLGLVLCIWRGRYTILNWRPQWLPSKAVSSISTVGIVSRHIWD